MTLRALNRLSLWGAGLLFFAGMGSIVVGTLPFLDNFRPLILWYLMLPCGAAGPATVIFEKLQTPSDQH